jgi:hypothetical protein
LGAAERTLDTADHSIDSRTTDSSGRRDASVNGAAGEMQSVSENIHLGFPSRWPPYSGMSVGHP